MAGFTESALSKKLDDLNASQQSIQTLSLWLIHHRKHHEAIVKMWTKELQKGMYFNIFTLSMYKLCIFFRKSIIHKVPYFISRKVHLLLISSYSGGFTNFIYWNKLCK